MKRFTWLNKNIFALSVNSLLSDWGQEMVTASFPSFLLSLGGSPALLGFIEGVADASISFAKIFAGWYSDFIGRYKPFATMGYLLTALGIGGFAFSGGWASILFFRVIAWLGKGLRKPTRDVILSASTEPKYYGRAFGFHRAMDTVGAVAGPLCALALISAVSYKTLFLLAFIPCFLSVVTIATFVEDAPAPQKKGTSFFESLKGLPSSFKISLLGIALFAFGNFAPTLLIMRFINLSSASTDYSVGINALAIILYAFRNGVYATFSYPMGQLSDRFGVKRVLVAGYLLTAASSLGFLIDTHNIVTFIFLFALSGLAASVTDGVGKAFAASLLPAGLRGTGYGVIYGLEGFGSFFSSALVGLLWTAVSPAAGFLYSAALCFAGALVLAVNGSKNFAH